MDATRYTTHPSPDTEQYGALARTFVESRAVRSRNGRRGDVLGRYTGISRPVTDEHNSVGSDSEHKLPIAQYELRERQFGVTTVQICDYKLWAAAVFWTVLIVGCREKVLLPSVPCLV
jgi:hypothetical protein